MKSRPQRPLAERFMRSLRVWRRNYRVCRCYARRWDATCSALRLTWACVEL